MHLNSAFICLKPNLQSILQYFLFWLKKSYLPQISFWLIARKPFQAQFRCHSSTSNADFFGTFKLTPFPIVLNGGSVYPLSVELGVKGPESRRQNTETKFWGGYKFSRIVPGRHFDDVII